MTRADTAAPASRRSRGVLLVALGVDNFGSGLFLPLVLVYVTRVVGLPLGLAGTVVAVGTVVGLIVPPAAGRLVDRVGPRAVVVTAQLLQAAGALAYLMADGVVVTIAAALLLAAGQQTFYSALFALVADASGSGPKDRPFALVNMVRSATFGFGALVAGVLLTTADVTGLRIGVGVNALSFLLSAVLLWVFVRTPAHTALAASESAGAGRRVLRDRPYLALIGVTGLVALVTDFFLVGAPVFALEELRTPGWVPGAMLALLTAITSVGGTAAVRRTRHLSRTTAMMAGGVLFAVWCGLSLAAVAVPASWQPAWLLATVPVLAAGELMFGPRANALAEAAAPRSFRGRYLAAFQYSFTVPGVVAPALVALFSVTVWMPWLVVSASLGVGIVGLRWVSTRLPAHAVWPSTVAVSDDPPRAAGVSAGN